MTTYRVPTFAASLAGDIKTPEQIAGEVAGMHETMRSEGERLLKARDQAARMMGGIEEFAGLWALPIGGFDPQQIDVHADSLVSACHVTSMAPYPRAVVLEKLVLIAAIDAGHPLVAYRELLRDACTGSDETPPDWSALDTEITARAVPAAGPSVGQACTFYAADGSEREGTVTHIWGPAMVNLQFTDVTGLQASATSVAVLMQADPGRRYYCVLKAAS